MSENKIFRKVSLDRLSSPEELDQRLAVTTPIGWLALVSISLLVTAALIWGFLGSISDKAVGRGIILSSGGITSITHHANGQITDLSINDGDYIEKGQVIARIDQSELIANINQSKADLEAAKAIDLENLEMNNSKLNYNVYGKIAEIFKDYEANVASLNRQRTYYINQKANAELELEQARINYENSLSGFNRNKVLYENGAISKIVYEESKDQLALHQMAYNNKKQTLAMLPLSDLQQVEAACKAQEQWLKDTVTVSIIDLENNIAKMQRDLVTNSEVVASASGRVLELKVKKGDIIQAGGVICTIGQENAQTDTLEAVVYVPVEQGKKIIPGMEVNISPSTVKKEEYGFMLGNVVHVSEYPASAQRMMLTLGNNELVNQLMGDGAPIEVKVKLVLDNSTASGYKWSTAEGPKIIIDDGTFCIGEVKVVEKRPISMVIPFIKKILPI